MIACRAVGCYRAACVWGRGTGCPDYGVHDRGGRRRVWNSTASDWEQTAQGCSRRTGVHPPDTQGQTSRRAVDVSSHWGRAQIQGSSFGSGNNRSWENVVKTEERDPPWCCGKGARPLGWARCAWAGGPGMSEWRLVWTRGRQSPGLLRLWSLP